HPHISRNGKFGLVHNGIVENFSKLKGNLLTKGEVFESQTDSEVIVKFIEHELENEINLPLAVKRVFLRLEGRNTLLVLFDTGLIVGIKNGSPLVVGKGKSGAVYFSSDVTSFDQEVQKIFILGNGEMFECYQGKISASTISRTLRFQ